MSIKEVYVPQFSESISEGTLIEWNKRVGDYVSQDEVLIEIETDKVVLEVPAPVSGVISEIYFKNGEVVTSGQLLAKMDVQAQKDTLKERDLQLNLAPMTSESIAISPAARKILEEKGIDPHQVQGTGHAGRITKQDALQASNLHHTSEDKITEYEVSQKDSDVENKTKINSLGERLQERVPMSRLRARVAERLVASQQENAILTTFNEVNMKPIMDLRTRYKDEFQKVHGVRLGLMSFFIKATVYALQKYPILNASIDGNEIVYHGYFDIGIAVGSPRGLVVPVLRNVDKMSIAQIEHQIQLFGQKAKDGHLALEDLTGGTFSISNGGVFGSMLSTPIINPPQSAILGIHATKDRPWVENGEIVIRPVNYLALSYDHRLIDGREAVLGLVSIKEALEDPARLLLDL